MEELKLTCRQLQNFSREYLLLSRIGNKNKLKILCYLINVRRYIRVYFQVNVECKARTLKKKVKVALSIQYICFLAKVILTNVCILLKLIIKHKLTTVPATYTELYSLNIYFSEKLVNMYAQIALKVPESYS